MNPLPLLALFLPGFFGLWDPDVERELLKQVGEKAFTTISCPETKGGCGKFQNEAIFAERSICPHCKTSLTVRVANRRNAPVSAFTERWARGVVQEAVDLHFKGKYFVERGVACPELSLTGGSTADLAILRRQGKVNVKPQDIVAVIEIKMSIIWNWQKGETQPSSDFDVHRGRPSIFRSDSLLKAIGKGAIFRSAPASRTIPYLVIGNSPPPKGYYDKIDGTVRLGIAQRFISLTPNPLIDQKATATRNPKSTPGGGFVRVDSVEELGAFLKEVIETDWVGLEGMTDRSTLGRILKSLDPSAPPEKITDQFLRKLQKSRLP